MVNRLFYCLIGLIPGILFIHCAAKPTEQQLKPVWIFILAGQSNMAGRGAIEQEDTIRNPLIWMLDSSDQWVTAHEPLHYYEPERRGLDCGFSFARELVQLYSDSIKIGLVPCAVGGSSVEQWLYDSTHRGVALFSNFMLKVNKAKKFGIIKGILWHQGEANANDQDLTLYSRKLDSLFQSMRTVAGDPDLPIVMGELGQFLPESGYHGRQILVNKILKQKTLDAPHLGLVSSADLVHKGDSIHFNSSSLRELGIRYARITRGLIH